MPDQNMAKYLRVSNSAYSNYENGYRDPPVEILEAFCKKIGIELKDLLELNIKDKQRALIETFAHFLDDTMELQNIGIPVTYSQELDRSDLFDIYIYLRQPTARHYRNRHQRIKSETCCRRNQQRRIRSEHRKLEKDVQCSYLELHILEDLVPQKTEPLKFQRFLGSWYL